jgi:hypothetical protein
MSERPAPEPECHWEAEQRTNVVAYLSEQGLAHGEVGVEPAWTVYPYVSVWAIESLKASGWVGWWAISGDLPTDCCSADGARDPRSAVRRIAESWNPSLAEQSPEPAQIGSTGLSGDLRPLLAARAHLLLELVSNEDLWPAP